jgi:very-short-patch-repair endonuclease
MRASPARRRTQTLPSTTAAGSSPTCHWPHANLIVELDGGATHHTRHAFERDRARDRKAVVSGHRVVRVTWRQLHEGPTTLAAELRTLLEAKYPDPRGP